MNTGFPEAVLALSVAVLLFLVFFKLYCMYKEKENFKATLRNDEYQMLGGLLTELDKSMQSISEPWFLCCGNVLGYCRHNGVIAWDDDFDVCVSQKAFDTLLNDMGPSLAAKGMRIVKFRDGLAKMFFIEKGIEVVQQNGLPNTRFPFIDIFAFTIANGTETDFKGQTCSVGQVHMSRATVPRCLPKDMIFPIKRVDYEIPFYGTMRLPIPNKPGHMVAEIYGPGALFMCVSQAYDHSKEAGKFLGGQKEDCASLSRRIGIKFVNNCEIPGMTRVEQDQMFKKMTTSAPDKK